MPHALVFYPRLADARLNEFRRRYDPWSDLLAEHVTLVHPAGETLSRQILVDHVRDVVARWAPFEIRLHGPEKSWDHWLLLPVRDGREQICRLHDELYEGPLAAVRRTDLEYTPALGLGFFAPAEYDPFAPSALALNRNAFETAMHEAKQLDFDYRCTLDSLTLIDLDEFLRRSEDLGSFRLFRRAARRPSP